MPGDYSRKVFDPKKRYSGVLMQQGRVQLDSDWNEQLDIGLHRTHTEAKDVIGLCGVPKGSDGFRVSAAAGGRDLTISPGRIYVGGLMCELDDPGATYTTQPHYPNPDHTTQVTSPPLSPPGPSLRLAPGHYLVYIDAWQHEITALDDRRIREVALGGPDTTTRLQTVWQVRLLPLFATSPPSSPPAALSCQSSLREFDDLIAPTTGMMNARTEPVDNQTDPCLLPPTAGYQRLENQLYRVQVHTGGDLSSATFKWSRDNSTVESTIEKIDGSVVTVASIGKDEFLGFAGGQWVEVVDEESELKSSPRQLVQIDSVDPNNREITMKSSLSALAGIKNAKLRRWDQAGANAGANAVRMNLAPWLDLEGGIQVRFSNGTYRAGDYWLIPARTATGEIEWPPYEIPNSSPVPQPPAGVRHYYCRLALISVGLGGVSVIDDCRQLFPPLNKLTQLHYVSGDGQEGPPGQELPHPLQVGVANGSFPVADARVRFRVIAGTGTLTSGANTGAEIVVRTGADGVVQCRWRLDATTAAPRVEATLVDHTTLPVRFNASFDQDETQTGIHVRDVRLRQRDLRNDTNVSFDDLAPGIEITCDERVNAGSLVLPTCFVTLDMPFPFNNVDRELWGDPVVGFQPLILDAGLEVRENIIQWRPSDRAVAFLRRLMVMIIELRRGERVLAHLTLKGNYIWAGDDRNLFLDGEVFGFQRTPNSNIDIRLPSGNGRRGGDFEMWFWLTSATTVRPNISVTPATLDFRATGGQGGILTLSVSNTGNAPLTVSSMEINNSSFQVVSPTGGFTVPAGGQQAVQVQFRTTATTEQTGAMLINSNDPEQPRVTVSLIGPGAIVVPPRPNIAVTPASIDFGTVAPGQTTTNTLTVRNTGNAVLAVSSLRSNSAFFIPNQSTFSIQPGGQQAVQVVFRPAQIGLQRGTITITSNDQDQPTIEVALRGTGGGIIG